MYNDQLFRNHYPAILFAFMIVGLMWIGYLIQIGPYPEFVTFGVFPQEISGLKGIIFSPILHSTSDIMHIVNNTIGMGIISYLLYYFYRDVAFQVLIYSWLISGAITWFIGEGGYHIGMSGVIYGVTFYLLMSGLIRKNRVLIRLSLGMVFLYGSLIWGIFPIKEGVSWEGHLGGLLAGLFLSFYYRAKGPKERKLHYEIEEELGIEPHEEYWLDEQDRKPNPEEKSPTKIVYIFKKNKTE